MNYIFLDVDGVLNHETYTKKCYNRNGHKGFGMYYMPFDPKCLKRLAKIVRKTNAIVVLSSTWRLDKTHIAVLNARLAEYGVRIENFTKNMNMIRGLEIKTWLKDNNFNWNTDNFIVIDDEIEDIITHIDEKFVIKTNFNYGLRWEDMKDAIIRLSNNKMR